MNATAIPSTSNANGPTRVALLFSGEPETRHTQKTLRGEFLILSKALAARGARVETVFYHDAALDPVREALRGMDAVLVWVNPIEDGRDRSKLDPLLCELSNQGIFVSTHPDTIMKLGTKEVLYQTRGLGWGCDTHLYRDIGQMRRDLTARLQAGETRVLKQYRGNGGNGVWKVERVLADPQSVWVRHAKRGCVEEKLAFNEFIRRCEPYFEGGGLMVDQAWQPRLPEGMIRCYLVVDRVEGFGHQAVVALHPDNLPPTPRRYYPATKPEFQALKRQLEDEWLPAMQRALNAGSTQLPLLWDCDFMLGPRNAAGEDSYVLCEINVSCVSPFPESAAEPLARAVCERALQGRSRLRQGLAP